MNKLLFNGIDPRTGTYRKRPFDYKTFLKNLSHASQKIFKPEGLDKGKPMVSWVDPKNIASAGWGVLVHETEPDETLQALESLIHHRRAQVGARFRLWHVTQQECRDPRAFMTRVGITPGVVDPEKTPYYLLIVGPPTRIPFDFQYRLGVIHGVGRLDLDEPKDYRSYCEKLVWTERQGHGRRSETTFFGPVNDELTQLSLDRLVRPLASHAAVREHRPIKSVEGEAAEKNRLLALLSQSDGPNLIFTAGHGISASDPQTRAAYQGGIICADWSGRHRPLRKSHFLAAEDIPGMDLRGLILIPFACYTAGTPEWDTFKTRKVRVHDHAFTAPLAKRLLSAGVSAVIGHIDLAHIHSFLWNEQVRQIEHFAELMFRLHQGDPVGDAIDVFRIRQSIILNEMYALRRQGADDELRVRYWISYSDTRNYVVLGDPAVRLGGVR